MRLTVSSEVWAKTGEIGFLCHARVYVIASHPQTIHVVTGTTSSACLVVQRRAHAAYERLADAPRQRVCNSYMAGAIKSLRR
jgi:hypothetical protein